LVEEGVGVEGVEDEGAVVGVERLVGAAERVERDAPVDDGLGVGRVEHERAVVRLQRLLVAVEVVEEDAAAEPGIRRERLRLEGVVDHAEGLVETALLEVVGRDVLEVFGVEERAALAAASLVGLNQLLQLVVAGGVVEFVELEIEHAESAPGWGGGSPGGRRASAPAGVGPGE